MSEVQENAGLGLMDKAAGAIGGMVGTAKAAMGSESTTAFISNARMGDLYEVAAAAVAVRRSGSSETQMLARMIVEDHTTSSHQLMSALRMNESRSGELPTGLDAHRQTMLDHLHKADDDEFDRLFLD